jgi:hypothetical protein
MALAAPSVLLAQDALPTGQEIRERYIEALGGRAALQAPTSSHVTGTFEIPANGISGDMEMFGAAPNKLFTTMEMPGFGQSRTGFDGEVAWTINAAMGAMLIEGKNLQQLRQQADFYSVLNPEAHIESFEPVARKDFEGKPSYEVKVVTKWGEEYLEYYEVETGLQIGSVRTQESPMGGIEATTVVEEYGHFGDILVPTRIVQRAMGMEQIMTITAIEYDVVHDSVFAIPPEIQELLKSTPPDTTSSGS